MTDYLSPTLLDHFTSGLSPRDQLVLESVGKLGWMLSGQVARLHFVEDGIVHERRCRDVLARLYEQRWLLRHEDRRIGKTHGGSGQFAYTLDLAGRRFLSAMDERQHRRRKAADPIVLSHALAVTELYVALMEQQRLGFLHAVGFLREFTGLPGLQPDVLLGLVPPSANLDDTQRWFIEVELTRKDATRLDAKLDAYVAAWRQADLRYGWSRFPRVLYLVGTLSRFPSDATLLYREIEDAIRRQPADARRLFALAHYEAAISVLTGRQAPATVAPDEGMPAQEQPLDPASLVLPREPPPTDARIQ